MVTRVGVRMAKKKKQAALLDEKNITENNILYQINEYELMEENEQYVLFLRPSTDADHYFTKGVTFGKVGVKNEDKEADSLKNIHKEARAKFNK